MMNFDSGEAAAHEAQEAQADGPVIEEVTGQMTPQRCGEMGEKAMWLGGCHW